ncbi:ParB/RepB/Spo0J family partition protein (plasmid) [Agrobacterium rosae]|uniref:ParB/RepB/Spo0J family partition protein n=1 Tax=Agrobacterium rosae TaxID=1972867 RepID=A0ABU4W507_9HYPH|nr:ParB/RepB/Spo0J family partition protein [Agrobacterium rosae]MDX8332860.1 ParB/RepB/Spo0J family partition protein [Agrobacterium rosae]
MAGLILDARECAATGIYQLLPALADDDFLALKADIEKNGVLVPVEYDENEHILDGHHRVAICKMLGITDWPRFVRKGLSEEEKRAFARSINFNRRHLSSDQKRKVVEEQLKDTPESSNRAIGAKLGVDHKTVAKTRNRLEVTGEIPQLERTTGADGKERRKPIPTMFLPERENLGQMKTVMRVFDTADQAEKVVTYLSMLNKPPVAGDAPLLAPAQQVPSRRENLRAAVGTATATKEERGPNLYETPPEAMHALLALENFSMTVLEPACGRGAIVRMLEWAGYEVALSDLVDYGTANKHGELQKVQDFLASQPPSSGSYDIVGNPPYGGSMNAFIAHALRVYKPRKMALLLNWNAYSGFADDDRNFVMDECPPARIYQFKRRLPMMHRDGWDGNIATSRMNTAWFVWEMQDDGSYGDCTVARRIDWKDYMPSDAAMPLALESGAV